MLIGGLKWPTERTPATKSRECRNLSRKDGGNRRMMLMEEDGWMDGWIEDADGGC